MNTDTLSYSSVIRAFESIGYNSDSCLSEYQYITALDKLVKRTYPQATFDHDVARELFEQNQKGIDTTVKVSSYAMAVVTAFQILVNRIVTESTNMQISGQGTRPEAQEILREAQQDSQTLLMAFGEKTTAPPPAAQFPQVSISPQVFMQSAVLSNSQVQPQPHPMSQPMMPTMTQSMPRPLSPIQQQPYPMMSPHVQAAPPAYQTMSVPVQQMLPQMQQQHPPQLISPQHQPQLLQTQQQPVVAKTPEQIKEQEKKEKSKNALLFTLLNLAGTFALIQLLMTHHKYHFFNLPASLFSFAIVGSRLKSNPVLKLGQVFYSACVVLSLYWMIEVAAVKYQMMQSPYIHALIDSKPVVVQTPGGAVITQSPQYAQPGQPIMGAPQGAPMSVVCIQQPSGQCSLVQTSQVVQGMPDPAARMPAGSAIAAANPTPTSHKSDFALQFILFIIGDGIKIVALVLLMKAELDTSEKVKQMEKQMKAEGQVVGMQMQQQPTVMVKKVQ